MKKAPAKPYLKKYSHISNFTIWIVDGNYIRCHLNEDFTNFGQHYRFKFIPKNEFWVDQEYSSRKEIDYFIDHLLVEHRLMSEGKSYNYALEKADVVEQSERQKVELLRTFGREIIQKIHKKLLKQYSSHELKVWLVHGDLVRDFFSIDFTEGGHDLVYNFIPRDEVWIDDDTNPKELRFILLHELYI